MFQRLTSCRQQKEKTCTKFSLKETGLLLLPKQYLLYHVPVCDGFVVYNLRLFKKPMRLVLWLNNNKKNNEKEDVYQWKLSTFINANQIYMFFFSFLSLLMCAAKDPL